MCVIYTLNIAYIHTYMHNSTYNAHATKRKSNTFILSKNTLVTYSAKHPCFTPCIERKRA